ncbi:hypothetical protein LTR66_014004, partial [Elasticomyces elasticus]
MRFASAILYAIALVSAASALAIPEEITSLSLRHAPLEPLDLPNTNSLEKRKGGGGGGKGGSGTGSTSSG